MPESAVRRVIESHRRCLMKIAGVTGVAVGGSPENPEERWIVLYTATGDRPPEVPDRLDGYEVRVEKASGFRAL